MGTLNRVVSMLQVQKNMRVFAPQTRLVTISRLVFDNKAIKIALLSPVFLFLSIQCYAQKLRWIPFYWIGYQTKTRYFDKSAIMLYHFDF
jgi:hypothetical protein